MAGDSEWNVRDLRKRLVLFVGFQLSAPYHRRSGAKERPNKRHHWRGRNRHWRVPQVGASPLWLFICAHRIELGAVYANSSQFGTSCHLARVRAPRLFIYDETGLATCWKIFTSSATCCSWLFFPMASFFSFCFIQMIQGIDFRETNLKVFFHKLLCSDKNRVKDFQWFIQDSSSRSFLSSPFSRSLARLSKLKLRLTRTKMFHLVPLRRSSFRRRTLRSSTMLPILAFCTSKPRVAKVFKARGIKSSS